MAWAAFFSFINYLNAEGIRIGWRLLAVIVGDVNALISMCLFPRV